MPSEIYIEHRIRLVQLPTWPSFMTGQLVYMLRKARLVSTTIGCAWKYGRSFLAATRRTSVACSRRVYRVSTLDRDLLTKNISLCFQFLSSLNKAALTKAYDIAK